MSAAITFKLSSEIADQLEQKASAYSGLSKHTLARQIVLDYLEDTDRQQFTTELAHIKSDIHRLREDLATAVAVLLVNAGKVETRKEAEAWVTDNLV